jgi:hypothetical protein
VPSQVTVYRVFIASPGGLEKERRRFRDVLNKYNESEALERGVMFVPVGWEIIPKGIGRPQEIINADVKRCDYFVLVLCDRWGSPPAQGGSYSSGTEEEFHVARACHANQIMRDVLVFFKPPTRKQRADPGPQLERVLEFRQRLEEERELLFATYNKLEEFEDSLRKHLGAWLLKHERAVTGS